MPLGKWFRTLCLPRIVLLIFAIYVSTSRAAGDGFPPISSEELRMKSEPAAPGASAIILYHQVDRDDDGRGTMHEDNYLRIKILTEEGRKHADVELQFAKSREEIVHINGRTIRPDGSVVNFDGKVFEKSLVKTKKIGYAAKTFTLPDVEVGGIIEYSYTVNFLGQYIYDSHWILSEELFTKRAQFSLKPYTSPYSSINLHWSWQGLPPGSEPRNGPDHIIRMETTNVPAFNEEDFMPPANELKSRVEFIYEDELPDSSPEKYWQRVGKQRYALLEKFIGKRKAMEKLISPSDTQEIKLQKIYNRVQGIRNKSYEISKTEQEDKRDKEKVD
ncbi:MAG: hypothetical protein QOD84_126, partial [Acidobacteriaceae bacterium]